MIEFFEWILNAFLGFLCEVLPKSPFADYLEEAAELPFIAYLNYFVPIGTFLRILGLWIVAVAGYYLYSVIARWVKLIE